MNVRAKMNVTGIELYQYPKGSGRVKMTAVHDDKHPENNSFSQATPSGECSLHVSNPPAFAFFKRAFDEDKSVYLDFTIAE